MHVNDILACVLRYFRKFHGLTQKDVSDVLGISQQTYAGYESGKHQPNLETLIRIADFYHLSLDYLVCRYPKQAIIQNAV